MKSTPHTSVEASSLRLHRTFGVDFDFDGHLHVDDSLDSRIVKVVR